MQDLLYIKVDELFWIVQDIEGSSDTDTVNVTITRLSDNYTWDFTNLEFSSSATSGSMIYVSGILWKTSFTPDSEDTYIIKIEDTTVSKTYYQTLIAKGGSEVLPFATATDVSICNLALVSLGADTISALDEDSENARKLNAVYSMLRDEVLRAHSWNFAIKWADLAQLDETPANDFTYAYQLPTDCLKVIKLNEDNDEEKFRIEAGKLYCDLSSVTIEYIAKITDATKFDTAFVTAFAARLAAELAYPITGDRGLASDKWNEYALKIEKAKSLDSQEGKADVIDNSNWLEAR